MSYKLPKQELTQLKARLTRAINTGDSAKIKQECRHAMKVFEEKGYPDCWSSWQRALDDVVYKQTNSRLFQGR